MLDDVALGEEDLLEHGAPLGLAPGQEFQGHRKVFELLFLGVLHDGLRLGVTLEGEALLVPADGLRLFLERGGQAGKGADLRAQIGGGLVILISRHSKETRWRGLNSAMTVENVVVFIVVGLVAGFLASRIVLGKGRGWFWDIIIGILGAILGGWLAGVLHLSINVGPSILNQIIIAFVGAVILLLVWRVLFHRNRK